MLTLPQQLNSKRNWIRWPLAVLFSLVVNGLLLGMIVEQVEPETEVAPRATASIIEEPPPPEPQLQQVASGASSSAWKSALPSAVDGPARPPSFDIPFDISAPAHIDPSVMPEPGLFFPDLGNYTVASGSSAGTGAQNRSPQLLNRQVFDRFYPSVARARKMTGESVLELKISAAGKVEHAKLVSSTPRGIFDKAALKGALNARFRPAMEEGRPVATMYRLRLDWTPPVK
ncbi:energy transducer TonB [Pontiellaceae bacterium B12219]|nr:energy transducer TonB [Pontiellaceae bacterium B12219]